MKRVENWFLILFIPLSLLMMIVLPIYRVPDELAHFERSYLIADGQMISSMSTGKVTLPTSFSGMSSEELTTYDDIKRISSDFPEETIEAKNSTATAIYPPVSYFPQAFGMWLMMQITHNRVAIFYAARVMNWLCIVAVLWWGIRKIPKGKYVFAFLALLPINMQQMISASADGLATAIVFALVAFVVHAMMKKPVFTKKDYAVMALISLGLVCWKVFYTPMVFLFLLIPKECFASARQRKAVNAACIAGALLLVGIWAAVCYLNLFQGASDGLEGSTMSMLDYLLQHPLDYFVRLGRDLVVRGPYYIAGIFATSMSWGNISPGHFFWFTSFLLCVAIFVAEPMPEMKLKSRGIMLGMSIVSVLIVFLLLYIWWTPIDSPKIEGFQGRYLLPLTLPVMLAVKPPQWKKEKLLPYLMGATVLVDIGFLIRIVQHIAV